jgi:hypothetical protein
MHDEIPTNLTTDGVPQLYFDQLNHIRRHLDEIRSPTSHKLTRRTLAGTTDWPEWEASEYKQLDQYTKQRMFDDPIPAPPDASVFNWVWTYNVKTDAAQTKKARGVCDGSTRGGHVRTLDRTYASCVEQTSLRLFFALSALENKRIYSADVSNAFAEAPPPAQIFYMRVCLPTLVDYTPEVSRHPICTRTPCSTSSSRPS